NSLMRITGAVDEDAMYVVLILSEPIDLKAVTFAAILIGALGAALDVSMSIASAVSEISEGEAGASRGQLAQSGLKVGRDIIGTQISTLVLAYIGGSLSAVLLLIAYQSSVFELLNLELVIIELLQSLVGAFTILFTIPATALVSAALLSREAKRPQNGERETAGEKRLYHAPRSVSRPERGEGEFKIGH
ncbi:MAG: YibE/F family protein, partial [Oscillospiraceae bacterium]|nr:YibE/F family protein [Oscillospiraceae bacterium]